MEHLLEVGVFAGKSLLIVFSTVAVLIALFSLIARQKADSGRLQIENIGKKFQDYANQLGLAVDSSDTFMKDLKKKKKAEKKKAKKAKKSEEAKNRVFLLEFEGDIKASAVKELREEVTALLTTADAKTDEVVVIVESSGGMVHTYGLAAAQLTRIRQAGLKLTVCVDKVAASGGYMMACTSQRLLCAPFAIVGSIGVVAQVPNLHRLLKKNDVDYEELTAGEYKRTVSMLAEITPKGKEKFIDQLEETHVLFKEFVAKNRPNMDISKVATGEYWYGYQAEKLGLVDEVSTSDEYLFSLKDTHDIFKIKLEGKKSLSERVSEAMSMSFDKFMDVFFQKNQESQLSKG